MYIYIYIYIYIRINKFFARIRYMPICGMYIS